MSKKRHHIRLDQSIADDFKKQMQDAFDHPSSLADSLIADHVKKLLSYEPLKPSHTFESEYVTIDCYNLIGNNTCAGLKKITDKVHAWLKDLIPEKTYKNLIEKLTGKASLDQIIEEELKEVDEIGCLAIIYGVRALRWLLYEGPYVCILPDFENSPGFNNFYLSYSGLDRLIKSKSSSKLKALQGIMLAIQKIHEETGEHDPNMLWTELAKYRLRPDEQKGEEPPVKILGYGIYYKPNPKHRNDTLAGSLFQKKGTNLKSIKYGTFRDKYVNKILPK